MHATYNFLINPSETEEFDPKSPPDAAGFESWFESAFAEHYCDENNWYQGELLIYSNGDIHSLCPENDWCGRDAVYTHYQKMRPSHRWQKALDSCARCLAYDFNLGYHPGISLPGDKPSKIDTMTYSDIMASLDEFIVERLEHAKQWFTNKKSMFKDTWKNHNDSLYHSDYAIKRLLVSASHFVFAWSNDQRFGMFAYPHSPYDDYRCMQLESAGFIPEGETEPPLLCIAMVDIHT